MSRVPPGIRLASLVIGLLAVLGLMLVRICADGGAMAGAYRSCTCRGVEWELYDATEADGPRRTICIGLVASRTCYQSRGGPRVPCRGPGVGAPSASGSDVGYYTATDTTMRWRRTQ